MSADGYLVISRHGLAGGDAGDDAVSRESHDDDGRPVALDEPGAAQEFVNAVLQTDRVDDALALQTLEPGFNDLPFGAVHHDRDLREVRLGGEQVQEARHGFRAVDQLGVHVHVDDVGAVAYLVLRDRNGRVEIAVLDEALELERAGDVAALADHDEVRLGPNDEHLVAAVVRVTWCIRDAARRKPFDLARYRGNPIRLRAAAAADDVEPALPRELAEDSGHALTARAHEAAHAVGQARVWVANDRRARELRHG